MSEQHTGNIFKTFEASLMVLSIASVKLSFKSILPKINRLPPMSNINDCTKFEDNCLKHSGH